MILKIISLKMETKLGLNQSGASPTTSEFTATAPVL
jgi:hypothetical protein